MAQAIEYFCVRLRLEGVPRICDYSPERNDGMERMITMNIDLKKTIEGYLQRFPEEKRRLARLTAQVETDGENNIFSRETSPGHITASAIVLNRDRTKVLVVHHNASGRTIQPGGHVEPTDENLNASAMREVKEETGISDVLPLPQGGNLIDISIHDIPAVEKKQEPAHMHYDFRYLFFISHDAVIVPQLEEVKGAKWILVDEFAMLQQEFRLVAQKIDVFLSRGTGGMEGTKI